MYMSNVTIFSSNKPTPNSCASWKPKTPKIFSIWTRMDDHNQILSARDSFYLYNSIWLLTQQDLRSHDSRSLFNLVIWRNPRILSAITPWNYFHAVGCTYCQFNTIWYRFQKMYKPVDSFSSPMARREHNPRCIQFPNTRVYWLGHTLWQRHRVHFTL